MFAKTMAHRIVIGYTITYPLLMKIKKTGSMRNLS